MKPNKHLYFRLPRRDFIRTASAGVMIMGAPAVLRGLTRRVQAADDNTISMLFTAPTMIPGDWKRFEQETGLQAKSEVIKDDPGLFLNEIMVNDGGDRYDLIATLAGGEKPLSEGGYILPIDVGRLKNWTGVAESIRDMPFLKPAEGRYLGVPLAMNADSFGYFPAELKEPRPPEEASWSLVFDSDKTKGRSSTGDNYIYLEEAAAYLKVKGLAEIANPGNLTPEEAQKTADYLIERKKAGQFRNFWTTFDDQVADITNHEVLAIRCWEPAVKEAQKQGLDFVYANAEFYNKWMHAVYIPTQVRDRGKLDQAYKALDWILGGGYASAITPLRGYVSGRPDLGIAYAKEHNLGDDVVTALNEAQAKVERKFAKPLFWFSAVPDNLQDIVAAMDRVLAA